MEKIDFLYLVINQGDFIYQVRPNIYSTAIRLRPIYCIQHLSQPIYLSEEQFGLPTPPAFNHPPEQWHC